MAESTAVPVPADTLLPDTLLPDSGPADSEPACAPSGEQILPLIDHLARVGRRAAELSMSGWLRPRHMIALQLLHDHGPMTQHAVGTALSLDPSNVVGLLNELEERGLIARRRDPADRRRHIVELSAAGTGDLARSCQKLDEVEDALFKSLTAQERTTLHSLLSRATASLAPDAACTAPPCIAPPLDGC